MAYPTNADLKSFCGVTTAADDALLTTIVTAAKEFAEGYTNRVFEAASSTKNFPVRLHVLGDKRQLMLYQDLLSVTTITNGDGVAVAASEYDFRPVTPPYYAIDLRPSKGKVWWDGGSDTPIAINGSWGMAAVIAEQGKLLILELGKLMYNARSSSSPIAAAQASGVYVGGTEIPKRLVQQMNTMRRWR